MKKSLLVFFGIIAVALVAIIAQVPDAQAKPDYFTAQYCNACHYDDPVSCSGCHAHAVHSKVGGSDMNLAAVTDKDVYQPGETMTVSVSGGTNHGGWVRVMLYDESGVEVARSSGPGGTGSGEMFPGPIVLSATAPATPGTYTFSASWYGNQYDKAGALFGTWVPDPGNPNHGEEVVSTNSFTVESGTPAQVGSGIGFYRDGYWVLDMNGNDTWDDGVDMRVKFGREGDLPVAGDWNGDGNVTAGIFRDGQWFLDVNGNFAWDDGVDMRVKFGRAGDVPVTGDWNGDGNATVGIFRDGQWVLDVNGNGDWDAGIDSVVDFGRTGDIPVTGDWNGDGKSTVGIFRDGQWFVDVNGNGAWDTGVDMKENFGRAGDMPVGGDWNGDGVSTIGIFRDGEWFLDVNGNCSWDYGTDAKVKFGKTGDTPVAGTW